MQWSMNRPPVEEIEARAARQRHDAGQAAVVDVREADEWEEGHIPGALHIPLRQLDAHLAELLAHPEVIVVCHSGQRSAAATRFLTQAGHPHARNLAGGMLAWEDARLPITS